MNLLFFFFFFSSRRRHTRLQGDWSSDVCSSDLLDFGEVDSVAAEGGERVVQRPDFVRDAYHETGAVVAGGRAALATEDEKARGVGGVVLNVLLRQRETVFLGSERAGDGGGVFFLRREFGGARVGRGFDD